MPRPGSAVDVVHSSPIVGHALVDALQAAAVPTGLLLYSWTDLVTRLEHIHGYVVIDAYLDDHVPLSLKVRAISHLSSCPIVLGNNHQQSAADRAYDEGAADWIEPREALEDAVRRIAAVVDGFRRVVRAHPPRAHLTDREIQILCLYASRRSISARTLGRYLGITEQTVHTHLKSGRAKYREAEVPVSNRHTLADALVEDGYLIGADAWQAEHRW
ncbi:response regulator transcription factor [Flexivirga sp. ID2601S]|uniref:Response regulator transcription factor n=1 Tax=Flexivirga aerilata TaxID=1656889 RepID=A0A849AGW9_9MICO|nr:HTH domain-containing protein [Flexivirga aerilata]NNG39639.1 response regulator transcription factor [Flexivirga aerilata]